MNPESAEYQVTTLDRALRARFMCLAVRPDRGAWLAWAQLAGVHPAIVALAQMHERIFDDVPPRYRGNIDVIDAPFGRRAGDAPALSDREIDQVVAFLATLTDGYVAAPRP